MGCMGFKWSTLSEMKEPVWFFKYIFSEELQYGSQKNHKRSQNEIQNQNYSKNVMQTIYGLIKNLFVVLQFSRTFFKRFKRGVRNRTFKMVRGNLKDQKGSSLNQIWVFITFWNHFWFYISFLELFRSLGSLCAGFSWEDTVRTIFLFPKRVAQ